MIDYRLIYYKIKTVGFNQLPSILITDELHEKRREGREEMGDRVFKTMLHKLFIGEKLSPSLNMSRMSPVANGCNFNSNQLNTKHFISKTHSFQSNRFEGTLLIFQRHFALWFLGM